MKLMDQKGGFALITSLIFTTLAFGYTLSYFDVITSERRLVLSSENAQRAEAIAEAGIEEAMWQYNYNSAAFTGWTISGTTASKTSSGFSSSGDYSVSIATYQGTPTITSTSSYTDSRANKQVQLKCLAASASSFNKAVKTNGLITVSGSGDMNSYNSTLGVYGGANIASHADLATNGVSIAIISVGGSADVYGNAVTGTGGTVVESGSGDLIGSASAGFSEVFATNVPPPALSGTGVTASITSAQTITVSGTMYKNCPKLDLSGSDTVTFSGSGTYYLYLTGLAGTSLDLGGSQKIVVSSGVTLIVYAAAASSFGGGGVVNNNTTTGTTNFQVYGTTAASTVSYSGNSAMVGTISSPLAAVSMTGSSDFYGSVVANTFTLGGSGNFHYDENLANLSYGSTKKLGWYSRID